MPTDAIPTWEDREDIPSWEDATPIPLDTSAITLSPYEKADLASMEAGRGKAETGMESDTMLTTAIAKDPLGFAAATAAAPLNIAGHLGVEAWNAGFRPPVYGPVEEGKPLMNLPLAAPEEKGIIPSLSRGISQLTTPENLLTIPFAAARPVQLAFMAQGAANIPKSIQNVWQAAPGAERRGAITDAILNAAMTKFMARGMAEKGVPNASGIPETEAVHGDVRAQPVEGQGQMPLEEGGARVRPEASGVAQEPQVSLSPEDQAYLDNERKGMDTPVEVVGGPLPADHPFAGQIATIDRTNGKIMVNPSEFSKWIKTVPEEQRQQAVKSLLDEERLHLKVDDKSATDYWNSMTAAEKAINVRRYTGKWNRSAYNLSDTMMGHEAVRFRLQQLTRMTPREVAEAVGKEKWTVQGITAIESAIRSMREAFGTNASKTQLAILDRLQENLSVAKSAAAPSAMRKDTGKPEDIADRIGAKYDGSMFKRWQFTLFDKQGKGSTTMLVPEGASVEDVLSKYEQTRARYGEQANAPRPPAEAALSTHVPSAIKLSSMSLDDFQKYHDSLKEPGAQREAVGELANNLKNEHDITVAESLASASRFKSRNMFDELERAKDAGKSFQEIEPMMNRALMENQRTQFLDEAVRTARAMGDIARGHDTAVSAKFHGVPEESVRSLMEPKVTPLEPESGRPLSATESLINKLEAKRMPAAIRKGKKAEIDQLSLLPPVTAKGIPGEETAPEDRPTNIQVPEEAKTIKVSAREIGYDQPYSELPFRPISNSESGNAAELNKVLTADARIEGSDLPITETKRAVALLDKNNGTVHLVSVHPYNRAPVFEKFIGPPRPKIPFEPQAKKSQTIARVTDPRLAGTERPNVPIEDVLSNYKPIYSILFAEPKKNFHQQFDSLKDFYEKFGDEAAADARARGTGFGELPQEHEPEPGVSEKPELQRPTDAEVKAFHDFFADRLPSDPDMFERTLIRTSAGANRQMVNALYKLMRIEQRRNRGMSEGAALQNVLDQLYENLSNSDTRQEFIQKTLAQSGAAPAEAVQAAPQSTQGLKPNPVEVTTLRSKAPTFSGEPPKGPGPAPAPISVPPVEKLTSEQQKALALEVNKGHPPRYGSTLYRQLAERQVPKERYSVGKSASIQEQFEEPPTVEPQQELFTDRDIAEIESESLENKPNEPEAAESPEARAVARGARQAGQLQLFPSALPKDAPAAIRKTSENVQKALDDHIGSLLSSTEAMTSYVKRRGTEDHIAAQRDRADNTANILADQVQKRIQIETADKLNPEGNHEVKAAANAVIQSGAFRAKYVLEGETLDHFRDLAKNDPQARALESARSSKDPEMKKNARLVSKQIYDRTIDKMIADGSLKSSVDEYKLNEKAKSKLDVFMAKVEKGIRNAQNLIKTGSILDRRQGREWIRAAEQLKAELEYAKAHWGEKDLMDTALSMRRELDAQYDRERESGYKVRYDDNYLPGRYDAEFFNDNSIVFGGSRVIGRQFRSPKTFPTYYDAIEAGPYISATRDGSAIVSSRVRQGSRQINKKIWSDQLFNIQDPVSGKSVAQKAVSRPDGSKGPASADHELVTVRPGYDPISVRKGFAPLIRHMSGQSALSDFAPTRVALQTAQRLKHTMLLFDFFHLGRLKYYDWSINGIGKGGYGKGIGVLEYDPKDMDKAVSKGLLTPEQVAWAKESVPVKFGDRIRNIPRHEIANALVNQGLNVGRIQDAIYKDLVSEWPVVGKYNKWLFDKFTRGLMLQTAVKEFERLNSAHPELDSRALMRDVSKDLNNYFGSIGRQGWIKSPTIQDLPRIIGLAPQWVEGLVTKEATAYSRASGLSSALGRKMPYLGTTGRGIARGLAAMTLLTQVVNMITRRQPTWKNEEDGHMFDAWIPDAASKGGDGFFMSPLSIFNELTHDVVRLSQTKPTIWDAVRQIGENKLGPWGKAMEVLATGQTPTHQKISSTAGVFKEAASQLIPVPISVGRLGQYALNKAAPNTFQPPPRGATQRQLLSTLGVKTEPAASPIQRMMQKSQAFLQQEGLQRDTGYDLQPTDEASYSKLRQAIRDQNKPASKSILESLRKTRTDDQIIKGMAQWASRPFTGSEEKELLMIYSLDDKDLDLYQNAMVRKQKDLDDFIDFMIAEGSPK